MEMVDVNTKAVGRIKEELERIKGILDYMALYPEIRSMWFTAFGYFIYTPVRNQGLMGAYVQKPETFNPDDFMLECAYDSSFIGAEYDYHLSNCNITHPRLYNWVVADAPFVLFLRDNEKFDDMPAILSTISFNIDFKKQTIFVQQIQGGDTWGFDGNIMQYTRWARRARFKFKDALPELFVYDAVEDLARRLGMKYIAIRRPEFNRWNKVRERATKHPGSTLYDKVAERAGFSINDKHLQYELSSVDTGVYFWKSLLS